MSMNGFQEKTYSMAKNPLSHWFLLEGFFSYTKKVNATKQKGGALFEPGNFRYYKRPA